MHLPIIGLFGRDPRPLNKNGPVNNGSIDM